MSNELEYLSHRVATGKLDRRAFMGRAAALGVGASLANSLLSSAAHAAGPQKGGILKAGLQGASSSDSQDPGTWASDYTTNLGHCWGECLVEVDPQGNIEGRLAESVEASADAKVWTFTLRDGVEFHNGKSLTAEDVVATIQRHSNEESKSGALGVVKGIESIAADGRNVVVTLSTPNADLPYLMSDFHLVIQPNGGMDDPGAGIGTGPYRLVEDQVGVRAVGDRFANYWDAGNRGHADQVEAYALNDPTARLAALQSGQVDMINRVEPKVVELIKRVPGVTVQSVSGRGHYVFIMHCNTAPFDNNDLRLALKYAINREDLVDKILQGYGSVGNDFPINGSYPFFSDDIEQRAYDPDKAAFHYKKSGHSGKVVLQTSDVAFPGAVDASQLFQQSAAAAGIDLEVKREPGDGYWSDVWNKQPFCASYWSGRPVQDQMYSTAYLSTADWNDTRFFRADFDSLVQSARAELDSAKRKQLYREAAVIVRDEGGVIVPMFNDFVEATGPRVGGWIKDPNFGFMNNRAMVKCWLEA